MTSPPEIRLHQSEPYANLEVKIDGATVASFELDDAPVVDWNNRQQALALNFVDFLKQNLHLTRLYP